MPSRGRAVGHVRRARRAGHRHGSLRVGPTRAGHRARAGRRTLEERRSGLGKRRARRSLAPDGPRKRPPEPGGIQAWRERLARDVTRRRAGRPPQPGHPRRPVTPRARGPGFRARAARSPRAPLLAAPSSAARASRPGNRGQAVMRAPAGRWSVTARPPAPGPLIRLWVPGLTNGLEVPGLTNRLEVPGLTIRPRTLVPARTTVPDRTRARARMKAHAGPRARAGRSAIRPSQASGLVRKQGTPARRWAPAWFRALTGLQAGTRRMVTAGPRTRGRAVRRALSRA
jgi:hypothetical protein